MMSMKMWQQEVQSKIYPLEVAGSVTVDIESFSKTERTNFSIEIFTGWLSGTTMLLYGDMVKNFQCRSWNSSWCNQMNFYWNGSHNKSDFTNQMIAFMQSFFVCTQGLLTQNGWKLLGRGGSAAFLYPDGCSFSPTSSIQFTCLDKELMYPASDPEADLGQKPSKVIQQT